MLLQSTWSNDVAYVSSETFSHLLYSRVEGCWRIATIRLLQESIFFAWACWRFFEVKPIFHFGSFWAPNTSNNFNLVHVRWVTPTALFTLLDVRWWCSNTAALIITPTALFTLLRRTRRFKNNRAKKQFPHCVPYYFLLLRPLALISDEKKP